jgi:hypothetical protein
MINSANCFQQDAVVQNEKRRPKNKGNHFRPGSFGCQPATAARQTESAQQEHVIIEVMGNDEHMMIEVETAKRG